MTRLALLVLVLLLGPEVATARPRPPSLEITLAVKKKQVDLLERVAITVTLKNKSSRKAEVPPLRLSDGAVTLVLRDTESGKEFRLRRLHGTFDAGGAFVPATEKAVQVRRKLVETIEMIAIRPGGYDVTAELRGVAGLDEPVESDPLKLTVAPPPEGKDLRVTIRTSFGEMTAELYPDAAYNACHEFVLHALDGYYGNGMTFFRVMPNFMVQTGDPSNTGANGWPYTIPLEKSDVKHVPGVLSLARRRPLDSANGQFFIMHGVSTGLDGKYTAFGKVIAGLPVLDRMMKVPRSPNPHNSKEISRPKDRIEMRAVTVAVR